MSQTHPRTFSHADLDRLDAEVLPGRLLLSVATPFGGGSGDTTVVYACQATNSPGTSGLLGTGLLAQPGYSSMTCIPSTTVHH